MHTPTNYFIVHLCVVNLLIMLLNTTPDIQGRIAPELGFVVTGWPGKIVCKIQAFIAACTINAAILTLALIAADRFIAIYFPLKRLIDSRRAIRLIAAAWLVPALPASIFLYVRNLIEFRGTTYCVEIWLPAIPMYVNTIYTTAEFIIFYALPLLEIIILYAAIIYKIWMRKIPGQVTTANQQVELKAKQNVLKMLIVAVLTFALFWLPIKVNIMISLFSKAQCTYNPTANFLSLFFACTNCAVNPLIYLTFSRDFRNGFKAICHCLPCFATEPPLRQGRSMEMANLPNTETHSSLSLMSFKKIENT
ncbi:hypothetical protein ACROYT_G007501 [Oculina patagonica]